LYDLVLEGGLVLDGSGSPAERADVAIAAGRIARVGDLASEAAAERLNVAGHVVAPGFIDMHSHSDHALLANREAFSKVTQGITTEVGGNCGFSSGPVAPDELADGLAELGISDRWQSLGEFLDLLTERGPSVNFCTLVGHGNLRRSAMGAGARAADRADLLAMRRLADQALDEGAIGISTGLIYPPGCYSNTDELVEVCRSAGEHGALYATHMRSEGNQLGDAVAEAIEIGRRSGARVQISHHKGCGSFNWGKVTRTLAMIDAAVAEGVGVWADQYPYIATSTDLGALLPDWVYDGGRDAALKRLADPAVCQRLRVGLHGSEGPARQGASFSDVMITQVKTDANRWTEGLRLSDVAEAWQMDVVDALLRLLTEERLDVAMCNFILCEEDVETVMRHPRVCIGTDATARRPDGPLGRGKPHPRSYGTFPRVLGRYVRERKVISLEEAVRKMTSLPAAILRLSHRGLVREGYWADLVVFDPLTVLDCATFEKPHVTSVGIAHVLVNGVPVVRDGQVTGATPGRVLRLQGDCTVS